MNDTDTEVLFYGSEESLNFPEYLKITTIEKDIRLNGNEDINILSADQLRIRIITHKRTSDLILSENGFNTFNDIKAAHFLIKYKKLNASKKIRDLVESKYDDVLEYYDVIVPTDVDDEHKVKQVSEV